MGYLCYSAILNMCCLTKLGLHFFMRRILLILMIFSPKVFAVDDVGHKLFKPFLKQKPGFYSLIDCSLVRYLWYCAIFLKFFWNLNIYFILFSKLIWTTNFIKVLSVGPGPTCEQLALYLIHSSKVLCFVLTKKPWYVS